MAEAAWCTLCGARFTEEEIEGATSCPKCGSSGVPCDPAKDTEVQINWHELRILGIWAGNWADAMPEGEDKKQAQMVIAAITRRLQQQRPDWAPLTMQGELMQLKAAFGDGVSSNIPAGKPIPVNGPGAVK